MDERLLYDTFSAFGLMATTAKVLDNLLSPRYLNSSECSRSLATQERVYQKAMVSSPIQISNLPTVLSNL